MKRDEWEGRSVGMWRVWGIGHDCGQRCPPRYGHPSGHPGSDHTAGTPRLLPAALLCHGLGSWGFQRGWGTLPTHSKSSVTRVRELTSFLRSSRPRHTWVQLPIQCRRRGTTSPKRSEPFPLLETGTV